MARALNGSQLIRDIQTRSRPHCSACDSQINLPIYTFKLFKTTRKRNETELNSLLACCSRTTRSAHKHRDVFQTAQHTDLIPLSCIPAFKMHMHGGLRLRCNTGNTSVLNHEGEPMDITKSTCKLCAIVMPVNLLASVIQKVKVKKLMEFSNAALTAHILSEIRDKSTSTCADNSINEQTCFKDPIHNTYPTPSPLRKIFSKP